MERDTLRKQLLSHRLVQRLMRNSNWRPAAEAAIAKLVDGEECPVPSWTKSSTWIQVEVAYRQITKDEKESPDK